MQELLREKIAEALGVAADWVAITVPELDRFGHYSTNVAMRLAREQKKPPFELAQEFAEKLREGEGKMFAKVEAVKPGFINFWISEQFLEQQFGTRGGVSNIGEGKTVIVEYADPNIAKPMHVGHSRPTFIGTALANIHEAVGYKVVRWNYIGDWGTQFGKLISAYKMWGSKEAVEKDPIKELVALYVRFHDEMKTKPELEKQGQEEFKKLEDGDAENRKLWEWFKDESMIAFHAMFKRLDVKFDIEIGEAYYEEVLYDTLKDLKEKELAVRSLSAEQGGEGALIINLDKFELPVALVQKSDGASLYLTRDIAGLKHRLSKYKPTKILYVVANEQSLHFAQLFAIADLLELKSAQLEHVKFGMVLGQDGKKLSTREGRTVQLIEVIDEVVERAFKVVSEKNPTLSDKEKRAISEIVGIGALKYNDLKENRNSDIRFDWDQMLNFNGDSAPYLQYTVVRLMNIIRKAKMDSGSAAGMTEGAGGSVAAADDEMKPALLKKILDFNDIVVLCAETCYTSHLAKYLFELAKLGNQYYESVRILDDENKARRDARLVLVGAVAATLTKGLNLLGIGVPERI